MNNDIVIGSSNISGRGVLQVIAADGNTTVNLSLSK